MSWMYMALTGKVPTGKTLPPGGAGVSPALFLGKTKVKQVSSGPVMPWQVPYVLTPMTRDLLARGAPLTALNEARSELQSHILAQPPAGKLHVIPDQRFTSAVSLKVIHW
jgi:hypothetical protein